MSESELTDAEMLEKYQISPGDFPAFPESGLSGSVSGLTKREYFAAMAMQGLHAWSHPGTVSSDVTNEKIVVVAVQTADLLIKELENKK